MERKTYLNRYRVCIDRIGIPVVIRRTADEATLKADDLGSSRQVAVQVGPASALCAAEREQLEAEARTAQQINHINIPALRDFGFEDDQLVYVTEYLEGTTAEDWIKTKGTMPASAVLRIALQVVRALGTANSQGIVHYAVHPGNIMLVQGQTTEEEGPLIKVLNLLGVAPPLPLPGTNGSALLNPADFASPEQLKDGTVDFRSEIYSLGCTLWFLLKGVPPAGGAAVLQNAIGLSAPLSQLLAGMLAENPKDRPSDMLAFQQQIQDCLAQIERHDVVATPAAAKEEIEPSPKQRSMWKPLALAAVIVAIGILMPVILTQRARQQQRAVEVATAVPEASALPSVTDSRPPDVSETERAADEAAKAPGFALNVGARVDENEQTSSDKIASSEASLLAQIAPTPTVEMMPSAPADQESIQEPSSAVASTSLPADFEIATTSLAEDIPVSPLSIETTASSDSVEQPALALAQNSTSPVPEIAAMQHAAEQLPTLTEPPPPAEAPTESEKPSAEISTTPPTAVGEEVEETNEEGENNNSIASPQTAPDEISKPARVAKPSMKKKSIAKTSPSRRPLVRDYFPRTTVGHIFPLWIEKPVADAASTASPPLVTKSGPRRLHSGASVGHIFYPVSSGRRDADSSSTSREGRRRSSAKKPPVSSL